MNVGGGGTSSFLSSLSHQALGVPITKLSALALRFAPKLYKAIQQHPNARELYLQQLVAEGSIDHATADSMRAAVEAELDTAMEAAKSSEKIHVTNFLGKLWDDYRLKQAGDDAMEVWTGFDRERLGQLAEALCHLPEDKNYFRKVKKLFKDRRSMVEDDRLD